MAKKPPAGPDWIHEIKHDGFRILARRDSVGARLITRNGHDFSNRFPFIGLAVGHLPARSCLVDGEAIVTNKKGLASFDLLRARRIHAGAVLCAFDLLELDGEDLRPQPIEKRERILAKLLRGSHNGITLNEHYTADGTSIFKGACKLGSEGIVSKQLGSPYRSGRTNHWLKIKNPRAPAATREWEEDWS